MTAELLDYAGPHGDARARETIARISLTGDGSAEALFGIVDAWIQRKGRNLDLTTTRTTGRINDRSELGEIEVDRSDERMVVRVSEADTNVSERRWTTELVAQRASVSLDARVVVEQNLNAPYAPRRTPLFAEWAVAARAVGFIDIERLGTAPRPIAADEIAALVELVANPDRRLPVVAVSIPNILDPADLALRLAGAAHVVTLDADASRALSAMIGRHRSVFHAGVRTYPPGFDWHGPFHHAPLMLGARIAEIGDGLPAIERIIRLVLARTARTFAARPLLTIRELDRQQRLEHDAPGQAVRDDITDLERELAGALAERDAFRAELDEKTVYFTELDADNDRLKQERDDADETARAARAAEFRWKAELDALRTVNAEDGFALNDDAEAPEDVDAFVTFVQNRYRGRLEISPPAKRYYRKGEYEDREQLVRVLDAIATDYYDVARGVAGADARWDAACERLHMKHGPSATATGASNDHRLRWNGQNDVMYHVRSNGTTFDPRRMLYVGFIFDQTRMQVVIGRLPSKPGTLADHT